MALDTTIQGGSDTANKGNVDSNFNQMVNTPGNTAAGVARGGGNANAGVSVLLTENDAGTVTGARNVKSPKTSLHRRFRVGIDTLMFNDTFNATTQNTSLWEYIFVTMTASQPGAGTLNFGTTQGTAATHGALMRSYQYFPLIGKASIATKFSVGVFNATLVANEEWRCGYGKPTVGGTAPTEGVWFLLSTAGLTGKAFFNGVEATTGTLATLASFTVGTVYVLEIIIGEQLIEFWRDGILLGSLANAVANGQPFQNASLPLFMQKICTGAVSNTNTMRVADINVYISDIASNKAWESQLATLGQGGNIGQNGNTQGKTSLYANSTAPTAVALTNTTAAFTGLGGQAAVLPTLAVSTDGILMAFQNPASTINITGRNLLIYGVQLSSHVSVVFDAAAAVVYQASLQYGHTAVSLATAETASFATATTHAPRVLPIGTISFGQALAAPVRTLGTAINTGRFAVPIVVRPGEFVAIVLKLAVGSVVTTTGAVTFMVSYDSVWE
jgi:hypothetical protein